MSGVGDLGALAHSGWRPRRGRRLGRGQHHLGPGHAGNRRQGLFGRLTDGLVEGHESSPATSIIETGPATADRSGPEPGRAATSPCPSAGQGWRRADARRLPGRLVIGRSSRVCLAHLGPLTAPHIGTTRGKPNGGFWPATHIEPQCPGTTAPIPVPSLRPSRAASPGPRNRAPGVRSAGSGGDPGGDRGDLRGPRPPPRRAGRSAAAAASGPGFQPAWPAGDRVHFNTLLGGLGGQGAVGKAQHSRPGRQRDHRHGWALSGSMSWPPNERGRWSRPLAPTAAGTGPA